jgi:MFS family permease
VANASLISLDWVNFLVGDMQTGFGPFVSVHLTAAGWTTGRIGAALGAGTVASLLAQVPAGLLVDNSGAKRNVAGAAIVAIMAALLLLALRPGFLPVLAVEVVQGVAGVVLSLSIAAITLALSRQEMLGERLGHNVRFSAIGAAAGAALLGFAGGWFSPAAVFVIAAGFGAPALLALFRIRRADLLTADTRTAHHTAPPPHARRCPPQPMRWLIGDRTLLVFMACVALFHLANAAQLPLAAARATHGAGGSADMLTAAALIVPQLLVAALSPWVGRMAQRHGRRPVLLVGFAALPARALLLALGGPPGMLVAAQTLDGVSGAAFGVLMPLVVADITHEGGRFNVALGLVGMAVGIGAALSNVAAGWIAEAAGAPVAFLALAAAGAAATVLVWAAMPETAVPIHVSGKPEQ